MSCNSNKFQHLQWHHSKLLTVTAGFSTSTNTSGLRSPPGALQRTGSGRPLTGARAFAALATSWKTLEVRKGLGRSGLAVFGTTKATKLKPDWSESSWTRIQWLVDFRCPKMEPHNPHTGTWSIAFSCFLSGTFRTFRLPWSSGSKVYIPCLSSPSQAFKQKSPRPLAGRPFVFFGNGFSASVSLELISMTSAASTSWLVWSVLAGASGTKWHMSKSFLQAAQLEHWDKLEILLICGGF